MIKSLLSAVSAFGLLLSFASAEEASVNEQSFVREGLRKTDLTRYVPSGISRTIWFVYAANPDCSSQGSIEMRTTKEPAHGAIEVVPGEGFVSFEGETYRKNCGGKKLRGLNVNYKSSGGYVGADQVVILALYPKGLAWEAHFDISVK
jgi:hypothetical protein